MNQRPEEAPENLTDPTMKEEDMNLLRQMEENYREERTLLNKVVLGAFRRYMADQYGPDWER